MCAQSTAHSGQRTRASGHVRGRGRGPRAAAGGAGALRRGGRPPRAGGERGVGAGARNGPGTGAEPVAVGCLRRAGAHAGLAGAQRADTDPTGGGDWRRASGAAAPGVLGQMEGFRTCRGARARGSGKGFWGRRRGCRRRRWFCGGAPPEHPALPLREPRPICQFPFESPADPAGGLPADGAGKHPGILSGAPARLGDAETQ